MTVAVHGIARALRVADVIAPSNHFAAGTETTAKSGMSVVDACGRISSCTSWTMSEGTGVDDADSRASPMIAQRVHLVDSGHRMRDEGIVASALELVAVNDGRRSRDWSGAFSILVDSSNAIELAQSGDIGMI